MPLNQPSLGELAPLFAALVIMFVLTMIAAAALSVSERRKKHP